MEASERPVSRRKKAVEEQPKKKKKTSKRSMLIQGAVVVVVFVLLILGTRNGGAPQAISYPKGNADTEVLAWKQVATYPDGRTATLCEMGGECRKADLEAALSDGATCTFSARAWLGSPDHPIWTVGVDASYIGSFSSGDFTRNETGALNNTIIQRNGTLPWQGGLWWRGEREEVRVSVSEVPCDTWHATIQVRLEGTSWTGRDFTSKQHVSVVLHREIVTGGDSTQTTSSG